MKTGSELSELMRDLVLESSWPPRELAKGVGKRYSTLMRELNPHDTGAKLGMETMLELMRLTGNAGPLGYMAQKLGYALCPLASADSEQGQTLSAERLPA